VAYDVVIIHLGSSGERSHTIHFQKMEQDRGRYLRECLQSANRFRCTNAQQCRLLANSQSQSACAL